MQTDKIDQEILSKILCIWHVVTRFCNTLKLLLNLNSFPGDSIIWTKDSLFKPKNALILYSFFIWFILDPVLRRKFYFWKSWKPRI